MPNIKSAKKRVLISAERREANMSERSELKTSLKKASASLTAGERQAAEIDLKKAVKTLDEAATKGLIHKNKAARKKSRLSRKLNTLAK